MFGLVPADSVEIKYPDKDKGSIYAYSFPGGNHATSIVEGVGMFLFAAYHVTVIIVLINMLIAMMSHSFEDIQVISLILFINQLRRNFSSKSCWASCSITVLSADQHYWIKHRIFLSVIHMFCPLNLQLQLGIFVQNHFPQEACYRLFSLLSAWHAKLTEVMLGKLPWYLR